MDPIRYPCTDSNCALRLRRPTLCPLSYRGGRRDFITIIFCHCEARSLRRSNLLALKLSLQNRRLLRCARNDGAYAFACGPSCVSSARRLSMIFVLPFSSPILTSCSFLCASSPQTW